MRRLWDPSSAWDIAPFESAIQIPEQGIHPNGHCPANGHNPVATQSACLGTRRTKESEYSAAPCPQKVWEGDDQGCSDTEVHLEAAGGVLLGFSLQKD